jgi:hypothetical protein
MRVAARIIQERAMRMRVGLPAPSDAPSHAGNFSDSTEARLLRDSYCEVIGNPSHLPERIQTMEGMSGRKYRALINLVVSRLPKARYLEVGSWKGSTVCAALHGNTAQGVCIDNWSEFGGPRDEFMANTANITSRLRVIEGDFRSVDYASLGKFSVYLFDGPHAEEDHRDGIVCALPALAERLLLIVDDWNCWEPARTDDCGGTNLTCTAGAKPPDGECDLIRGYGPAVGPLPRLLAVHALQAGDRGRLVCSPTRAEHDTSGPQATSAQHPQGSP